ncbi:MAG: hypothetical protein V4482_06750 [Pseudomonadota bacterium]
MRISFKQTLLMGSALLMMQFPLVAMNLAGEVDGEKNGTTVRSAEEEQKKSRGKKKDASTGTAIVTPEPVVSPTRILTGDILTVGNVLRALSTEHAAAASALAFMQTTSAVSSASLDASPLDAKVISTPKFALPEMDEQTLQTVSLKATVLSTNFFGETAPDGMLDIFKGIAFLLTEGAEKPTDSLTAGIEISTISRSIAQAACSLVSGEKSGTSLFEQFSASKEAFTEGSKLLRVATHSAAPHPDFNAIYAELMDNFLSTTTTEDNAPTTERLRNMYTSFRDLIDTTNASISAYEGTKSGATADIKLAVNSAITQQKQEKKNIQRRLTEMLKHFSTTRTFIMTARNNIEDREKIIEATPITLLQSTGIIRWTNEANSQSLKNINYLKKTILQAETLLHGLYSFKRINKDVDETSSSWGKAVTATRVLVTTALGKIVNVTDVRRLRNSITGASYLPNPTDISTLFTPQSCLGATDQEVHDLYTSFINAMLEPTLALEDAVRDGRILFIPSVESIKLSAAAEGDS